MQLEFDFVEAPRKPEQPEGCAAEGRRTVVKAGRLRAEPGAHQGAIDTLRLELARRTKLTVALTITDNRSRMISYKHDRSKAFVHVRLHHMFLSAGPEVVRALAHWIVHPRSKKAGTVVDEFIRGNRDKIKAARKRPIRLETQGVLFDLTVLFNEINTAHFDGAVAARITWGSAHTSRRRSSIRFGSYDQNNDLIRIHPVLDQDFVPRYFVRYIVFHEMLHAYLGTPTGPSGRRRLHPPEFKRLERGYPDYARAVAWQDKPANLRRLLRSRATSRLEREIGMRAPSAR